MTLCNRVAKFLPYLCTQKTTKSVKLWHMNIIITTRSVAPMSITTTTITSTITSTIMRGIIS